MTSGAVLLTGANGFLGQALCRHLAARGYSVKALVRNPGQWRELECAALAEPFSFELGGKVDQRAFDEPPAAVIHNAWAMEDGSQSRAANLNLDGMKSLLQQARASGCEHFIFISTLSAHDQASSVYGQTKLKAERLVDEERDLVVRPGMIIGDGGLLGRMRSHIEKSPWVPIFYGGQQQIQHIAIDDVCVALERALDRKLTGRLDLAHSESTGIRAFYKAIGTTVGRNCRFIRIPGSLALASLRIAERLLPGKLPITSENLLGLKEMRVFDTRASMERLGIHPQDLESTLAALPPGTGNQTE